MGFQRYPPPLYANVSRIGAGDCFVTKKELNKKHWTAVIFVLKAMVTLPCMLYVLSILDYLSSLSCMSWVHFSPFFSGGN